MRAIYVRTSTGRQDGQAQLFKSWQAARARGWGDDVAELVDLDESGRKAIRPALEDLRRRARAGELREVLVVAIDRLGRNAGEVVRLVDELAGAGVVIHSLREGTIDPGNPIGRVILQIVSALAELEHGLIVERVKAGIERARVHGTKSGRDIGRPTRDFDINAAKRMRSEGRSWRKIAVALKVPMSTLRRQIGDVPKGSLPAGASRSSTASAPEAPPRSRRK